MPLIAVSPSASSVLNGTTAILHCEARGIPAPSISWLHAGEVIVYDDRRQLLVNGSLLFSPIQMTDAGVYRCRAENEFGIDYSDEAQLTVDSESSIIALYCSYCISLLQCSLSSARPPLTLRWLSPQRLSWSAVLWACPRPPLSGCVVQRVAMSMSLCQSPAGLWMGIWYLILSVVKMLASMCVWH